MSEENRRNPLRDLWASGQQSTLVLSPKELMRLEHAFARSVYWRNLREYAAAVLGMGAFIYTAVMAEGTVLVRIGCAALVAGMAFITLHLQLRGSTEGANPFASTGEQLAFLRRQLVRQRDLSLDVWRWYLAPTVPGILLFLMAIPLEAPLPGHRAALWCGSAVAGAVVAGVFYGIVRLNRHVARGLQREIDALVVDPAGR